MSDLSNPIFHNADLAREWLEARIWPEGPICPHCGSVNQVTLMKQKAKRLLSLRRRAARDDR